MAYCDEDKRIALLTLDRCKGDYSKTAIMCREFYDIDVSRETIRQWANGNCIDKRTQENLQEDKRQLAEKLEEIAHRYVNAAKEADLSESSPTQLMTTAAIAIDKMLLLRGEATSISQKVLSEEEINLRIAELRAKLIAGEDQEPEGKVIDVEFSSEEV